jgi:hypothetical protein
MLLSISIFSYCLDSYDNSKRLAKISDKTLISLESKNNLSNSNFNEFRTGNPLTGNQVKNAIRIYASKNLKITVTTKLGTKGYEQPIYNQIDSLSPDYIEPTAQFQATEVYTTNGTLKELVFTQQ